MSFTFKDRIGLTIFGSSHGEAVGAVLDGIPAGFYIDGEETRKWRERRAPGKSAITTQRRESDRVSFISGLNNGYTDGGSITMIIQNEDAISKHYDDLRENPRPGHGDLSLFLKYGKFRNYAGGGFLSGRMTAPLVAAGSIAVQILKYYHIEVVSYLEQLGMIRMDVEEPDEDLIYSLDTRMAGPSADSEGRKIIAKLMSEGDSTGGTVKTIVRGTPASMGEPFFDSVESILSHLIFSIPGVKGIEFGDGFSISSKKGSESNEPFKWDGERYYTDSNRNGGILGGITYGDDIVFRTAFKPTSSIRKEQETINVITHDVKKITVKGRHDPCIAIRAVPVVKCVASLGILDLFFRMRSSNEWNLENDSGN